MNKLLILTKDAEKYAALIETADLPQLEILATTDLADAAELVADCNILLAEPPMASEILNSAGRLEWMQSNWAGIDALCRDGLRRNYQLTTVKDIFGPLISEYVMTYLFALERRIFDMRTNQLKKHWQPKPYRLSAEITLGIIGLGSIGRHVAETAQRFGIRVIGLNRSGAACAGVDTVYTQEGLADFLAEPDYVVLALPSTAKTRHFVNAEVLSMMKSTSVLMNVGRGSVVNEADLVTALDTGVIGAAVLDVFETEPLPVQSPLWSMPNVYITPHFAAASFPEDVIGIFVDNYQRFLEHEPLMHLIDFERGY